MGEFIVQIKRLLKVKWKQIDARNKTRMASAQENVPPKKEHSTEVPAITQVPGSRLEGGREYTDHKNVQYVLPRDVQELDRLHQQHWVLKVALQGNFEAPIEEDLKRGITVLDSGCGPGTWTLDMAETYPNSKFHGMDMAPVFPEQIKPLNCEFRLGNLNEKLPYPDNCFDYIHQRLVVVGLTAEGWKNALSELYRVLKPGGWIELKEVQNRFQNLGPLGEVIMKIWIGMLESKGIQHNVACELGSLLEKNGFENINHSKLSIPINHGGMLGTLSWNDIRESINSVRPLLAKVDPETFGDENFEKTVETFGKELAEYGTVSNFFNAYGRKPLA